MRHKLAYKKKKYVIHRLFLFCLFYDMSKYLHQELSRRRKSLRLWLETRSWIKYGPGWAEKIGCLLQKWRTYPLMRLVGKQGCCYEVTSWTFFFTQPCFSKNWKKNNRSLLRPVYCLFHWVLLEAVCLLSTLGMRLFLQSLMPLSLESVHLLEKVQIASEAVAVILVESH